MPKRRQGNSAGAKRPHKTINTVVELTEKELECVAGGMQGMKVPELKIEPDVVLLVPMRCAALDKAKVALIGR